MTPQLTIVLLGHGAIAKYVDKQIQSLDGIHITAMICRETSLDRALDFAQGRFAVYTAISQLDSTPDLVVDCAGHSGLMSHAPDALQQGIDVLSISSGALASQEMADKLDKSARQGSATIRFLSGAVAGIDALRAASVGELDRVMYTGSKPPRSWVGSPAEQKCDLANLTEPFEHFSGTARQAARQYPKNANVAATIALASIGLDQVNVRLIADPHIDSNIHEITAQGVFGKLSVRIEGNALPENPGSSALAAMSLVAELKRLQQHVIT